MSYIAEWQIPQRLIHCQLDGTVTLAEIKKANKALRDLVAAGQNPIHCILELQNLEKWPVDFRLFQEDYPFHDAHGWIIFVGANAMMRYVGGVVARFAGAKIHSCASLEEAIAFLKEQD